MNPFDLITDDCVDEILQRVDPVSLVLLTETAARLRDRFRRLRPSLAPTLADVALDLATDPFKLTPIFLQNVIRFNSLSILQWLEGRMKVEQLVVANRIGTFPHRAGIVNAVAQSSLATFLALHSKGLDASQVIVDAAKAGNLPVLQAALKKGRMSIVRVLLFPWPRALQISSNIFTFLNSFLESIISPLLILVQPLPAKIERSRNFKRYTHIAFAALANHHEHVVTWLAKAIPLLSFWRQAILVAEVGKWGLPALRLLRGLIPPYHHCLSFLENPRLDENTQGTAQLLLIEDASLMYGLAEGGHLDLLKTIPFAPPSSFLSIAKAAVYGGHLPVLDWLIESGLVDFSERDYPDLLFCAIYPGHLDVAKTLMERYQLKPPRAALEILLTESVRKNLFSINGSIGIFLISLSGIHGPLSHGTC